MSHVSQAKPQPPTLLSVFPSMLHFRETQRFPIWADLIMLGSGFVTPLAIWYFARESKDAAYVIWLAPAMILVFLCLFRMKTEVTDLAVTVTFGWIPCYRRTIPLQEIVAAEPIEYNPIRDYGGWGIRGIPVVALNARGKLGVQLSLACGRKLMIGSQYPNELAQAIHTLRTGQ